MADKTEQLTINDTKQLSTLNDTLRFFVLYVNILFLLIGLLFMAIALYLIFADWGSLDKDFFVGAGVVVELLGFVVFLVSILGFVGVLFNEDYKEFWSRRRIMAVFEVVVVGALVGVIYLLCTAVIAVYSLRNTVDNLTDDPSYTALELSFSRRFNSFYFGALSSCDDSSYKWFWKFVSERCTDAVLQTTCQTDCGTLPNGNVTCTAIESSCAAGTDSACPYTECREGIIHFMLKNINPFAIAMCVILGILIILAVVSCLLICYTPRDDLTTQLFKSGTLSYQKYEEQKNRQKMLHKQVPKDV